jgi:hypothetical protein
MFHNETFVKRQRLPACPSMPQVLENTGQGAAFRLGTPLALLRPYSRQRIIER